MSRLTERDRLILELWNNGYSVDVIGRVSHLSDSAVYCVVERRRAEGYEVKKRYHYKRTEFKRRRAARIHEAIEAWGHDPGALVSVSNAARLVCVQPTSIYKAMSNGRLRFTRDGYRKYVSIADLLEWAES